jgi:hypothetical protein
MTERAEEFARMAAELRGQKLPSKAERDRELIDQLHPPEPKPERDETNLAPIHADCHRDKTEAESRRARS